MDPTAAKDPWASPLPADGPWWDAGGREGKEEDRERKRAGGDTTPSYSLTPTFVSLSASGTGGHDSSPPLKSAPPSKPSHTTSSSIEQHINCEHGKWP